MDAIRKAAERNPNTTVGSYGYWHVTETPSALSTGFPAAGWNKKEKKRHLYMQTQNACIWIKICNNMFVLDVMLPSCFLQ